MGIIRRLLPCLICVSMFVSGAIADGTNAYKLFVLNGKLFSHGGGVITVESSPTAWADPGYSNMIVRLAFDTDEVPASDTSPIGTNVCWFGTGGGMPTYYTNQGTLSACYYFDAISDTGFVSHTSQFVPMGTGNVWTISYWACIKVLAQFTDTFLTKGQQTPNYNGIKAQRGTPYSPLLNMSSHLSSTNAWQIYANDDRNYANDYVWQHVIWAYNGSKTNAVCYKNGTRYDGYIGGYSNLSTDVTNSLPLYIAAFVRGDSRYNLNGWIDDIRVYTNWTPNDAEAYMLWTNQVVYHGLQLEDVEDMEWWSRSIAYLPCEDGIRAGDYSPRFYGISTYYGTNFGSADGGSNKYVYYPVVYGPTTNLVSGGHDVAFTMDGWYMWTNATMPSLTRFWGIYPGYQQESLSWYQQSGVHQVVLRAGYGPPRYMQYTFTQTVAQADWVYLCWVYDGNKGMRLWTNGVECSIGITEVGSYTNMQAVSAGLVQPYYSFTDLNCFGDMCRFALGATEPYRITNRYEAVRRHFGK